MVFYKKFFLIVVVITGLLVANLFVAKNFLENSYFGLLHLPLLSINEKTESVAKYGRNILHVSKLTDEVALLRQENNKLLSAVGRLKNLEEENNILRTRLNLAPNAKRQYILATIFNLKGDTAISGFMIDKGSDEGVTDGLAVITAEGILAGVVSRTYLHSALVLMPQSKELTLNVKINGTNILARSQGNDNQAVLNYITSQEKPKTGDLVVTGGLDSIPEAIPVFKVSDSHSTEGGLFQDVSVVPIFNILETSKVFIIK